MSRLRGALRCEAAEARADLLAAAKLEPTNREVRAKLQGTKDAAAKHASRETLRRDASDGRRQDGRWKDG